ncbi:MAG: DUF47 family protein [Armatimonadota bacterium]|nr:DUF47 family protein [Armatimonadota bacterium]MDR7450954.1 DUF47 family protein [Armatimonadota bacterium]MDR7465876.1 DUF47 family protein [Armatimonadota bacterium]MDR7493784.1 DUF47 family protein [Armatimonadota bacterium]MDR7498390.1 DUF47 family protein [Armatimonadota bacterium]
MRLLPREEVFFDLFTATAENILAAARGLRALLEDFTDVDRRAGEIKALEDRGDELTHGIIDRLNRTFVTPLDRDDIFALAKQLDDVIDWIEASSSRLALYRVGEIPAAAKELGQIIVGACEAIAAAVAHLRRLDRVAAHLQEIHRLENLADLVQRDAIARLFAETRDPIDVIKWKEILETLEEATDQCEHVAHVLESIQTKHL